MSCHLKSPAGDSVQYRALLKKAQKHPHGEKYFKRALIEHASVRMGELIQAGATDTQHVKALNEALVDLKRYVCNHAVIMVSLMVIGILQSSYMEGIHGITVAGLITGSSALHPKSSNSLHVFGPTSEITNMMDVLLKSNNDVQAFIKTSIL